MNAHYSLWLKSHERLYIYLPRAICLPPGSKVFTKERKQVLQGGLLQDGNPVVYFQTGFDDKLFRVLSKPEGGMNGNSDHKPERRKRGDNC